MKKSTRKPPAKRLEKNVKSSCKPQRKYRLRLYVTGATSRSTRAIENLKTLCEQHLAEDYELEIVDIYQKPELAKQVQLIAAPTLVKEFPLPLRRFIGDMSNTEHLLAGLEIVAKEIVSVK
jgi:circadian clock protein KaiB